MDRTIGVIGLGNMGGVIARKLSKTFTIIGYDIDLDRRNELENEGVSCVDQLELLAQKTNIILVSLPNGKISRSVVSEIIPFLKKGDQLIETSTVLPNDMAELQKICEPQGVKVIDAAILGGVKHIEDAKADFLVGGHEQDVKEIEPILLAMGKKVNHMGELGTGMSAKVINNAIAHTAMVLIVEAAAIGKKLGISHEKMYDILSGETTYVRPVNHRFNERIANSEYEGGMSTFNARKDSTLILDLAQQLNVPLFSIQASHTVYEIAQSKGYGDLDYASIAKLWEEWCQFNLAKS